MIRSITKQKPFEEVLELLNGLDRVFLAGCGTCSTLCRTGGMPEVLEMETKLKEKDKIVTGHMVIPVACDELSHEALEEQKQAIGQSEALLSMSCTFGVQTIAR